jgi:galactofuranosylgalactofuranosylrhamnosyl-N-acetylglucosaminyl-diphospho-decaprenol beta-1,5/1,6-galactofuranosyltransferase
VKESASVSEATTASPSPTTEGYRVVQRLVLPTDQELDVQSLYVSGVTAFASGSDSMQRQSGDDHDAGRNEREADRASETAGMAGFGRITDASGVAVDPEKRVTLGTYFNAFPASYWRRWTEFTSVRLSVKVRGSGSIIVYRSTSKGHVVRADSKRIDDPAGLTVDFDLPLKPFIDGGWYWFDLEGGQAELVLEDAHWGFETERVRSGRVTIGITTFNRPDFCVAQLANLSTNPAVLEILDEVVVVDQGTNKVVDDPGYEEAAAGLGAKLRIIDQPNLGGSGGFSRAMNEAVSMGASDYVLLLDDDVVCELEGILRAVAFADLVKRPSLVGGQMFSLYDRSVMHAYGEAIAKYRWFWGPVAPSVHGHDFSKKSLRSTSWMHRRIDVDYNGWWMCLIPTQVIREIGLSLPMFIKWDDAEFGLRAGAHGYPTVTLPGVAVWHVPWTEKDDTLDWQAYFHERNRLVSALLHSPYPHGGKLVRESFENHVKRLMSMQYGTGEIILLALQDVIDGPDRMHHDILNRLQEVRALRDQYDDGKFEGELDAFPSPRRKKPPKRGKGIPVPATKVGKAKMAAMGLVRQALPTRELSAEHPEGIVPHVDQRWYRLAHFDSAIVSTADGVAASWYRRDPDQFRDQIARSAKMHARLYKEWDELAERWRSALPELTSPERWKLTFEGLDAE